MTPPRGYRYRNDFVHWKERRHVTVGEAKNIMLLPQSHLLAGDIERRWRQNGNAVMHFMAEVVARAIIGADSGGTPTSPDDPGPAGGQPSSPDNGKNPGAPAVPLIVGNGAGQGALERAQTASPTPIPEIVPPPSKTQAAPAPTTAARVDAIVKGGAMTAPTSALAKPVERGASPTGDGGVVKTVSFDQREIIASILSLYCSGGLAADVTYSTGGFYKGGRVPEPGLKFDINPQAEGVQQADCRRLPLGDGAIPSVMFDPPFLANSVRQTGIIKLRFGCMRTMPELWDFYRDALKELNRVLAPDGILICKCQDVVASGRRWPSSHFIHKEAAAIGLGYVDTFVLIAKSRPLSPCVRQLHSRSFHSYFLVFRKNGARNLCSVERYCAGELKEVG